MTDFLLRKKKKKHWGDESQWGPM